ncbi:MAG: sulfatase [Candidatus Hodarchaeota archaeon]
MRRNFLFIITDQQRKDHISCYNPNMVLKTPNIDKIAENGVRFTNFYCNNPICMPNRSTIFTGKYPSVHGVVTNGRNLPKDTKTFVDILLDSGLYHTASFGKIHLNYFGMEKIKGRRPKSSQEFFPTPYYRKLTNHHPYFGLDEIKIISGHGIYCGHPDYFNWVISKVKLDEDIQLKLEIEPIDSDDEILKKFLDAYSNAIKNKGTDNSLQIYKHDVPEHLYSTTFVKENTIAFLENFAAGKYEKKNFFVFCSFPDPHHPFTPAGKYFDMYNPQDIKLTKSFDDSHKNSNPIYRGHYNGSLKTEGTEDGFPIPKNLTEFDAKRCIAASYGMEKMIDDAVGEILNILDKTGLVNNTIIIFTTDHGDLGGDHRFFFKGPFLYKGLTNIPFIIKIPDGLKNRVCNSLASSIDIPETILKLAGFPIPSDMQGNSLVSLLKNPDLKIKDSVFIEMNDEIVNQKSKTLITEDWRITIFEDSGELFYLKEDPDELDNLWNNDFYKGIKMELLLRTFRKSMQNQGKIIERHCGY